MADSLLKNLRAHSEIAVETAELDMVRKYAAKHVNLAASRITAAAQLPEHADIVDQAIGWAQKKVGRSDDRGFVAAERRNDVELDLQRLERLRKLKRQVN